MKKEKRSGKIGPFIFVQCQRGGGPAILECSGIILSLSLSLSSVGRIGIL